MSGSAPVGVSTDDASADTVSVASSPIDPRYPVLEADDTAGRLALAVGRLNRRLRPARTELSHGLLLALSSIVRSGPLRPGELARIEEVAAPTATRLLVELEHRGLVERTDDPEDGRAFVVTATDAGREAIRVARAERAAHASELLATLSPAEYRAIAKALDALEKAAQLQ